MDIRFKMPVEIVMRENCVQLQRYAISAYGSRAVIIADNLGTESGALEDITAVLREAGTDFVIASSAAENYLILTDICGLAEELRPFGAEFVVSIGGPAAINTGKGLSLLAAQPEQISKTDITEGNYRSRSIPHIVIPTKVGCGNETTPFMTYRTSAFGKIHTLNDSALFARLALFDWRYTAAISWDTMVSMVFATIGCAVEAVLAADSSSFIRAIAWESLANTSVVLSALGEDLIDIEIRRMVMYDNVLAGIAAGQTHAAGLRSIGWLLTRDRGIPHGKAIGLLLVPYLDLVRRQKPHLVDTLLHSMGFQSLDGFCQETSRLLANKTAVSQQEIGKWAAEAALLPDVKNCTAVLTEETLVQILQTI